MRKLPERRAGTTSPAPRIGPDAEALPLGPGLEGGASVDRQLPPDGEAAREPELRPDAVAAAGYELSSPAAQARPASPRARPAVVEPLAPGRYKLQFTASAALHDKLERLRDLMRPSVPDAGQCRYGDERGRRCTARQGLQFRHRRPFGLGGDHSLASVALACRCHNGYLAEIDYGREAIARHRRSGARPLEPTPPPSP
jgi:hypothetical protein